MTWATPLVADVTSLLSRLGKRIKVLELLGTRFWLCNLQLCRDFTWIMPSNSILAPH